MNRVKSLVADCRSLAAIQATEVQKLTSNAEALARLRHLQFHLITEAEEKIHLIGEGRKQILEQNGIVSAADIQISTILKINGFGQAMADSLMAWKYKVLGTFLYDLSTAISPGEHKAIVEKLRYRERSLHTTIDSCLFELQSVHGHCARELSKLADDLKDAVPEWEQAEVDLREIRSQK